MNTYSLDSAVRIGTVYWLDDRGVAVRAPVVSRSIYFISSYQMGTEILYGGKIAETRS
jgi:hypothetical protein